MLNCYGDIKICDFGVSKKIHKGQILRERCGTPAYVAPELLKNIGYDGVKIDIWSAGVVLYAMLYGNFPFRGGDVEDLEHMILKGKYTLGTEVSEEARDLITKILSYDPSKRPTISEIFSHPWMKSVDERSKCIK